MTVKMKINRKRVVTFLWIAGAVALFAVACGRHGKHVSAEMMRSMALDHVDDLMDEIDATDAQRAEFETLTTSLVNDVIKMKKEHKAHKKEAIQALRQDPPDRDALHAHVDGKIDKMETFVHQSLDKVLNAFETLEPEQQKIVLDKLAKNIENH